MAVIVSACQVNDDLLSSSSSFLHSIYESQCTPHIPNCGSEDSLVGISINLLSRHTPNSNLQKKTAIVRPKSSPVCMMASRALRKDRCEIKLTLQQQTPLREFHPQAWECEIEEGSTVTRPSSAAVHHSGMAVRPSSAAVRHSGKAVWPSSERVGVAVRPSSAVVRSNTADLWLSGAAVQRSVRPGSAVAQSSRAAVRPGSQSSARPSSAVVVRPRPSSAPGQRKARPKTALGIVSST